MRISVRRLKLFILFAFCAFVFAVFLNERHLVKPVGAFSTGPPAGHTGAPGESTCTNCHVHVPGAGQLTITPPQTYTPGQTYQIVVRHTSSDPERLRWGFQLTALAGGNMAGDLTSTSGDTQTLLGGFGREYIEHTFAGTFGGQSDGAFWTFNWMAPATNVGAVTFYAAGNQANNDGTPEGDRILVATATSQPNVSVVTQKAPFDFDGDTKTDVGIFRPAPAEWWYVRSSNNGVFAAQFGASGDVISPGDFTGDGKADIAFFRPSTGQWFVLRSEDLSFFGFPFGAGGDVPVPADYDGDSKADAAVYRPSSSSWFILRSGDGGVGSAQFGITGDQPVAADYDGDGKADIGIFRPNGGTGGEWWIQRSTAGLFAATFGTSTDKTVQGDWTGDGKTDCAFFRPSTGTWFVLRSEDQSFFGFPFGSNGDVPAPGDYDGDGKFDAAVFRQPGAQWFVLRSTAGVLSLSFGAAGDRPVPNAYVR